jgi:hypothetical protein
MTAEGAGWVIAVALLAGCTHSDSFVTPAPSIQPPFSTGPDVQISFNVDQDYWPSWNGDGKGILYAYVDRERPLHRCLGMLAPAGGTRLWQLCANRAIRDDSMTSFAAFAMDTAGQLLVAEAVSSIHEGLIALPLTSLWLSDTAHPYVRTTLLTLPTTVDGTPVTWLSDLAWTGPHTFIGLGQQFNTVPHCVTDILLPPDTPMLATQCNSRDTVFADTGGVVLRGTIAGGRATLQAIAGTEGATDFSLAEGGASIVFTVKHHVQLFTVPTTGGSPVPNPATAPAQDTLELAGLSCKGSTCIVAQDAFALSGTTLVTQEFAHFFFVEDPSYPTKPLGTMELHRVTLGSGADELLASNRIHDIFATPRISPVSGDVIVQTGGGWGHLQTFATRPLEVLWFTDGDSKLHLLKGIVP